MFSRDSGSAQHQRPASWRLDLWRHVHLTLQSQARCEAGLLGPKSWQFPSHVSRSRSRCSHWIQDLPSTRDLLPGD